MVATSLPDERTDFVSTNRLGHGWGTPETGQSASHFSSWLQGWL